VVNVSEGRDLEAVAMLAEAGGRCLLDVHIDGDHNRSVLTLGGAEPLVERVVRDVATAAVRLLDIGRHSGVHPRIGVLDVVPWVAVDGWPLRDADPDQARRRAGAARDRFALWVAGELGVPVFLYGPERSLPDLRKKAWRVLAPDVGPARPHPTAGAVAAGWRPLMVAYNLWMAEPDLARARAIATAVRSPAVRSLAFPVRGQVQVSCNLVDPSAFGPADIWDQVSYLAPVARAELVGLVPERVLQAAPKARWAQLDLAPERTIEARLLLSAT
jgi:glutamate formiminotransferase